MNATVSPPTQGCIFTRGFVRGRKSETSSYMRLISVNVSSGRTVEWNGRAVRTSIFKEPVSGRVAVRATNLEGDRQSDLSVHGGEHKAVYAYSAEHYAWWRDELGRDLPYGMFGENLTIEGFDEGDVCVGDVYRVGGALLQAVQPRLPCYKLGIRFGDQAMVKRFMAAGRYGVYFRVLEEGDVGVGDVVERVSEDAVRFAVQALARLIATDSPDPQTVRHALDVPALAPSWRERLNRYLEFTANA